MNKYQKIALIVAGVATGVSMMAKIRQLEFQIKVLDGTLEGLIDALYQERVDTMFSFITDGLDEE